ncbi:uncharacterized protein LOC143360602 isoform X2 [Halictus rubicundus]|uniref:uncharacterized protein LOC143360602 isoform X2 n=1 Tax=Halictus rubicundus TaxID=77578 RepID=UPI004036EEE7
MEVKKKHKKVDMSEKKLENSQDSLQEEKNKLKRQIAALRSIILELECNLDICAFKDVKTDSKSNALDTCFDLDNSQVPDVNVELETQLFRFAGFRCLEFTKKEFIFNLSPLNKYDKEHIFVVQVLCKDAKWSLGKWTMPMSIDLGDLVGQFSDNLKDVPNFIRTCKHYLDCYHIRHEQFNALEETISCTKNCNLQTSDGYTHMMLNLMGVHSAEYDEYVNLVIYIEYNLGEIRPNKVDVDLQNEQELNDKAKQQFKSSIRCFKSYDLSIAFEKMLNDSSFTWAKDADEDSPLEINNSDGSDEEGFLENFLNQKRKYAGLRKRQKKRGKGDFDISRYVERNTEPVASQNEKRNTQNSSQYSINGNKNDETGPSASRVNKNNEAVPSTSHVNKNNEAVTSTSHVHNLDQKKLKQAKLNFQLTKNSHVNPGTSREPETPKKYGLHKDVDKVITSTPMRHSGTIVMETGDLDDISAIGNTERTTRIKSIKKRIEPKLTSKGKK